MRLRPRHAVAGERGRHEQLGRQQGRRRVAGLLLLPPALMAVGPPPSVASVVEVELKDLSVEPCKVKRAGGAPGTSSFRAKCFKITASAYNPSESPLYNADVFGKIVDADNDPVLRSGRVGSIDELAPGISTIELQITVAASQTLPLKLTGFKAQGFTQTVNRSENPYTMDYTKNTFPRGTRTAL